MKARASSLRVSRWKSIAGVGALRSRTTSSVRGWVRNLRTGKCLVLKVVRGERPSENEEASTVMNLDRLSDFVSVI